MAISAEEFLRNYKVLESECALGRAHAAALKSVSAQLAALPSKETLDAMIRNAELARRIMPPRK
ncbi:hypothetical protein [Sorangium cellulosum]|uniref:hypothetical protein n=1 Tax=Sorangium cellulosum TaxID=56 RepID=UPI0005D21A4E|nr:hypothetical protein [Sorangium cellulosum]